MPRIRLIQPDGLKTIAQIMMRTPRERAIFDRHEPFADAAEAQAHLGDWLGDPTNIDALMDAPIATVRRGDKGLVGDVRIDAVLAAMLHGLGIDARAFGVAVAFDDDTTFIVGDVEIDVTSIQAMTAGDMTICGRVQINAEADEVYLEIQRIEMSGRMPETILDACVGRRVSDVVSHPLLDPIPLIVKETELRGTGTRIYYEDMETIALRDVPALGR